MTESGARSGAIDAVRVLGVAAVVAGHSLAIPVVRPLVYSWHVPLFFFLAGYFWSADRPVVVELRARTRTLARPYVAWWILIALVFVPLDATRESTTAIRLLGPFVGERSALPYITFWFVSALFATVMLLRILWVLPRAIVWAVAIAGSICGSLFGDVLAHTPLSIGNALPCLIFLMLGTLARLLRARIARPGLVGVVLLVISIVLVASKISAPLDIKQGDYGIPVVSVLTAVAISFGLVLVAESLFARVAASRHSGLDWWLNAGATRLAYAGLAVVLLHPLVLWLMRQFVPPVSSWIVFLVTLVVPWVIGVAALRTSASPWLTGVARVGPLSRRPRASRRE
ncbi:acyltransferase family protein [Leifsonia sp. YAF41]|uniref:acyltransferase family protein n=1 Tax=Leifsonia sp. YAF41 TaxID=3233086 RepID=UPI003F9D2AE3